MRDFRDLQIWSRSHELTLGIYKATQSFPREEIYGLTSQMRRSSLSVPPNIAEGCGRGSDKDFSRFLQIAMGSASELDYQLILAKDLGYLMAEDFSSLADELTEIKKMLNSFIQALKAKA